jgi:hypothetical protein
MSQIVSIPQYLLEAANVPITIPGVSTLRLPLSTANTEVRGYQATELKKSRLGTLIYESLELYNDNDELVYQFPDAVLVVLAERPKVIVKTPIQGKDSTVKEYIGMDDWHLTITGALINPSSKDFPEDLVSDLRAVYEQKIAFKIQGSSLCALNIYNIVLEDLKFERRPGYPSTALFTIKACSDEPIELEILNS